MGETKRYYQMVIDEFYEDPTKAAVLNEFFERIFERGQIAKVFFVTPHGEVTVIREGKSDEERPHKMVVCTEGHPTVTYDLYYFDKCPHCGAPAPG